MININIKGVFFSYKYAAIQLIKQGRGGRIIGAASIASKVGTSKLIYYNPPVAEHWHDARHATLVVQEALGRPYIALQNSQCEV